MIHADDVTAPSRRHLTLSPDDNVTTVLDDRVGGAAARRRPKGRSRYSFRPQGGAGGDSHRPSGREIWRDDRCRDDRHRGRGTCPCPQLPLTTCHRLSWAIPAPMAAQGSATMSWSCPRSRLPRASPALAADGLDGVVPVAGDFCRGLQGPDADSQADVLARLVTHPNVGAGVGADLRPGGGAGCRGAAGRCRPAGHHTGDDGRDRHAACRLAGQGRADRSRLRGAAGRTHAL